MKALLVIFFSLSAFANNDVVCKSPDTQIELADVTVDLSTINQNADPRVTYSLQEKYANNPHFIEWVDNIRQPVLPFIPKNRAIVDLSLSFSPITVVYKDCLVKTTLAD